MVRRYPIKSRNVIAPHPQGRRRAASRWRTPILRARAVGAHLGIAHNGDLEASAAPACAFRQWATPTANAPSAGSCRGWRRPACPACELSSRLRESCRNRGARQLQPSCSATAGAVGRTVLSCTGWCASIPSARRGPPTPGTWSVDFSAHHAQRPRRRGRHRNCSPLDPAGLAPGQCSSRRRASIHLTHRRMHNRPARPRRASASSQAATFDLRGRATNLRERRFDRQEPAEGRDIWW